MARIHHINGWMRKYKEMGNQKDISGSGNRIQFLKTVADVDQSKIDTINEYMDRVEKLGHFSEVESDNATLARCIRELESIQKSHEKDKRLENSRKANMFYREKEKQRKEMGIPKGKPRKTITLNKETLRSLIKEKEIGIRLISEELGYGETRLQGILGQKRISMEVADKISAYFNVTVESLTL